MWKQAWEQWKPVLLRGGKYVLAAAASAAASAAGAAAVEYIGTIDMSKMTGGTIAGSVVAAVTLYLRRPK